MSHCKLTVISHDITRAVRRHWLDGPVHLALFELYPTIAYSYSPYHSRLLFARLSKQLLLWIEDNFVSTISQSLGFATSIIPLRSNVWRIEQRPETKRPKLSRSHSRYLYLDHESNPPPRPVSEPPLHAQYRSQSGREEERADELVKHMLLVRGKQRVPVQPTCALCRHL